MKRGNQNKQFRQFHIKQKIIKLPTLFLLKNNIINTVNVTHRRFLNVSHDFNTKLLHSAGQIKLLNLTKYSVILAVGLPNQSSSLRLCP